MCFWTKSKNKTTIIQNIKHKNPSRCRELNPTPLAPKADALRLRHTDNSGVQTQERRIDRPCKATNGEWSACANFMNGEMSGKCYGKCTAKQCSRFFRG